MKACSSTTERVSSASASRIRELDGVRGCAIALVIVWHYIQNATPVVPGSLLAYCFVPLRLTWTGVDLFFVLSGFLIGTILQTQVSSPGYYRAFYARRAFRILPLYLVWLIIYLVVIRWPDIIAIQFKTQLFDSVLPTWSYFLFLQNFYMVYFESFGSEWLGITWSLAVEEQFYFVMPFIVKRMQRPLLIMACLGAFAPIVRTILYLSGSQYFGPYTMLPSRIDALAVGVCISAIMLNKQHLLLFKRHSQKLKIIAILLLCGMFVLTLLPRHGIVMNSIGYTWIAAFYGSILLLVLLHRNEKQSLMSAFLGCAPLVRLGSVSYLVYLSHQAMNSAIHLWLFNSPPRLCSVATIMATIVSLICVLVCAAISQRAIETPLLRYASKRYVYT